MANRLLSADLVSVSASLGRPVWAAASRFYAMQQERAGQHRLVLPAVKVQKHGFAEDWRADVSLRIASSGSGSATEFASCTQAVQCGRLGSRTRCLLGPGNEAYLVPGKKMKGTTRLKHSLQAHLLFSYRSKLAFAPR
eukprot:955940-Pelagomonas_calceolata.AAC.2